MSLSRPERYLVSITQVEAAAIVAAASYGRAKLSRKLSSKDKARVDRVVNQLTMLLVNDGIVPVKYEI